MGRSEPQACGVPEMADTLPLYALDALDEAEYARMGAHIAECPACQAQLDQERATLAELARLAPPVPVPIGMRERTLMLARGRRLPSTEGADGQSSRNAIETSGVAGGAAAPGAVTQGALRFANRPRLRYALLAVAAILLAALLPWNIAVQVQLARQQAKAQQVQQAQQELAAILASPHLVVYPLHGTRDASATGHVYVDPDSARVAVIAQGLPALSASKTYQAWLNHDGVRTSVGILRFGDASGAVILGSLTRDLGYYQSLGITTEPAGGSSHPTGPNVMLGQL